MSSEFPSPYQPPNFVDPKYASPLARRPGVVVWFRAYCVFMILLYLLVAGLGVVFLLVPEDLLASDPDMTPAQARFVGTLFMIISLPFAMFYLACVFMPPNKAGWIMGIVAIALGLTSACTLPMTIPLLIFWIKDETRVYYKMKR